jgi:hypothetical protein
MNPAAVPPGPELPDETREDLRHALLDEAHMAARMRYVSEILALIINVEDFLAIDSWLGSGKVSDIGRREEFGQAFSEFRAVATVASMSAELAEAAVDMAKKGRYYAVGAVIRQLIECEYLLTWGEMRAFPGARQLAGAEPWRMGAAAGYPAPVSWTVKPSFSSWFTRRRAWCSLSWREVK